MRYCVVGMWRSPRDFIVDHWLMAVTSVAFDLEGIGGACVQQSFSFRLMRVEPHYTAVRPPSAELGFAGPYCGVERLRRLLDGGLAPGRYSMRARSSN